MNTVTVRTPSMTTQMVQNSLWDRCKQRVSAVFRTVRLRFEYACEAYRDRVDWEMSRRGPKPAHEKETRTLVGYLFPLRGGDPVALLGGLQQLSGIGGQQTSLRVESGFIQCMSEEKSGVPKKYYTNERMRIGTSEFLLKLLEENYQLKVNVPKLGEGERK